MNMIAFPLNDDGLVWDMDRFIQDHHGRKIRQSISSKGVPLLHVEFPDAQDIVAEINRQKLQSIYREAA